MTYLRLDRFTYRLVVHAERREYGVVHAPCGVRECSGGDRKRLDGLVKHMQCDRDPVLSTDTAWSGESFGLERATHWSWSRYVLAAMGGGRDTD